ncbi:MAG TPA: 2Fe-2S iron-sulfur cluster binding domain-containing protein [Gammaproteobacteria bacterium]|nr:2Fe-2S iron-sulfur cluster binding domain-containing protein [Gammaproteobacteria bacterium]
MPKIIFEGEEYQCEPGESVLDCLLRQGVSVNYSCKAGVCQTCMMVAEEGEPTPASQVGIKETLKASQHFLICSCQPQTDMRVAIPERVGSSFETTVLAKEPLSADVIRLRLARPDNYDYLPGQFLNLTNDAGVTRSYSLASLPQEDEFLECHIRHIPGGRVSGWVAEKLQLGDTVTISQASGQCSYLPGREEQPLLLVGTGTGLAPLFGIARDALQQGHRGPIHLYHGSSTPEGLYLVDELRAMDEAHENFHYHSCVSRGEAPAGMRSGRAADLALEDHPQLSGWRVFLCGREDMVKGLQKKTFLAGAGMQDIFADPFIDSSASGEDQTAA